MFTDQSFFDFCFAVVSLLIDSAAAHHRHLEQMTLTVFTRDIAIIMWAVIYAYYTAMLVLMLPEVLVQKTLAPSLRMVGRQLTECEDDFFHFLGEALVESADKTDTLHAKRNPPLKWYLEQLPRVVKGWVLSFIMQFVILAINLPWT